MLSELGLDAAAGGPAPMPVLVGDRAGRTGAISDQRWHWGWTAGGGVEIKLSQDWSAKVEYLYVGLQDKSYFTPTPSPAFPGNQRLHLDDHIVRVGVNYKLPWNILDSFFKH